MTETTDTTTETAETTEDVEHIVNTLLNGSHDDEQAEHNTDDIPENGADPGSDSRAATEKSPHARDTSEIDDMIERCDVALDELQRKIDSGRVRDADKERVRVQWMSTLSTMLRTKRQLIEARQVDELAERIEALEDEVQ